MSDLQQELSQSLDLGDLNLNDLEQEDTVEGNIRMDIQPDAPPHSRDERTAKDVAV